MIYAIETTYAGHRFRSRLEARWAVFLDHLGVPWEYEPQGYKLPSGPYLPDFHIQLGDTSAFLEVKPDSGLRAGPQEDDPRWHEFSQSVGRLYVTGGIPRPEEIEAKGRDSENETMWSYDAGGWDNYHAFCICEECGAVGIEFSAAWGRVGCCKEPDSDDGPGSGDHPRILEAYAAARKARFEHGETA